MGNWSTFKQDTDGDGDWDLDQARTHNEFNEITQIDDSAAHVAHDRCGNMTCVPKPDDWGAHYDLTYDAWNRLVSVTDGASQDLIAEYEYDGRNYRITKTLPTESAGSSSSSSGTTTDTETRHFYYNRAWQCLEERLEADPNPSSSSGTPVGPQSTPDRQFTWGARYIDDLILRGENTDTDGMCDDERLYYLTDANFNITCLVDENGDAQERYLYAPYGQVTIYTGDWTSTRSTSAENNEILYTGRRLDAETGLYYYRARYYSAELGRFVTRDPIGYRGGMNLYEYVHGSPLDSADPTGAYTFSTEQGKACSEYEQGEIKSAISRIEATLQKRADCWQLPNDKACACRPQLSKCILTTLASGIKFQCVRDIPAANAALSGRCGAAKKGGNLAAKPPIKGSYDCSACSIEDLAETTITFERKMFVPKGLPETHKGYHVRQLFFHGLLMHELLHACVGDHGDKWRRPDARNLAMEYMINCGEGWVASLGGKIWTEFPPKYVPQIVPPNESR